MSYGFDIKLEVVSDRNASIATLSTPWNLLRRSITASSKRAPGDKANIEIGNKLAIGRALEKAGKILIKEALRDSSH